MFFLQLFLYITVDSSEQAPIFFVKLSSAYMWHKARIMER